MAIIIKEDGVIENSSLHLTTNEMLVKSIGCTYIEAAEILNNIIVETTETYCREVLVMGVHVYPDKLTLEFEYIDNVRTFMSPIKIMKFIYTERYEDYSVKIFDKTPDFA